MNISSVVKASNLYPVVSNKPKHIENSTTEANTLVTGEAKSLEKLAKDSGAVAREQLVEIEHYNHEEEPWLTYKSNWSDWSSLSGSDKKKLYLFDMTVESIGRLRDIRFTLKEFSGRLKDLRPDIAEISYGFTLDEDANIKILDGRNKLSEADKRWLTDEINKFKNFRTTVHAHSTALMTLVDHREDFGGKYNLNRHNFQSVIDYGEILNMRWENQHETFIKMVHDYAPRKSDSLINTHA